VGPAAAFLPMIFIAGFAVLAASPMLMLVIAFQAIQRTANFAISNPAREVLFTVVDREEKYKAKYLIDGVVFRGGDALAGWAFNVLRAVGLELSMISLTAVPVAAAWMAVALVLGKAQERRAHQTPDTQH
jgi:AAA family ATP:ADP antiporter